MSKWIINQSTLTDIADAIREKNISDEAIPVSDLANEIRNIKTGGELPAAILTYSDCSRLFSNSEWTPFITAYGRLMNFEDITDAGSMFQGNTTIRDLSKLNIPLVNAYLDSMFGTCHFLEKLPQVTGTINSISGLFASCWYITTEEVNKFFENITKHTSGQTGYADIYLDRLFSECYKLRSVEVPLAWVQTQVDNWPGFPVLGENGKIYSAYYYTFFHCYSLDSIENLPVLPAKQKVTVSGTITNNNPFTHCFTNCNRLKDVKFNLNSGAPYVISWQNVALDLAYVGYGSSCSVYGGFTDATRITDATSYQTLKNNPDSWTSLADYSRYNHDSAVRTIGTLPDVTGGSANIIKFKGVAGALTDGGAINTLTEEEIAVASSKGWTVSFT